MNIEDNSFKSILNFVAEIRNISKKNENTFNTELIDMYLSEFTFRVSFKSSITESNK